MRMRLFLLLAVISCVSTLNVKNNVLHIVLLRSPGYSQYSSTTKLQSNGMDRSSFTIHARSQQDRVLQETIGLKGPVATVHRYTELANGFSVPLNGNEVDKMRSHDNVLMVAKDGIQKLFTTQSFQFLGYNSSNGVWRNSKGANIVVGIIDTGVWPEHPSFSDKGITSIPPKFRGKCDSGTDKFKCNRKLIGARFFGDGHAYEMGTDLASLVMQTGDYYSPRDIDGHGTHVASTAAGSIVSSASVNGLVYGSPRGAAFSARLSVYKVFWGSYATDSDIILAMNTAVQDGVDVLSLSLGGDPDGKGSASSPIYYSAYLATLANVPVVYAAGNSGPEWFTVTNAVPWVLTVAATTISRTFPEIGVLGNGSKFEGLSMGGKGTPLSSQKKFYPLISSDTAYYSVSDKKLAELCAPGYLNPAKVSGKIVLCLRGDYYFVEKMDAVESAGGVGIIIYNQLSLANESVTISFSIPGMTVKYSTGKFIKAYISKTKNPKAYLLKGTISTGPALEAPEVASFSSAGPNGGSLNVIKPDISAPGVEILAAGLNSGYRFLSGTSMAAPHVSGTIALLKSIHPSWTPSKLFSALMTTASQTTNRGNLISANGRPATPFNKGSGQINANAAKDPGLVYPISNNDYNTFLCSPDYGLKFSKCGSRVTKAVDLNLPSISFYNVKKVASTTRSLLNVGPAGTYTATFWNPLGAKLSIVPSKLVFAKGQALKYTVKVNATKKSQSVSGALRTTSTNPYSIRADIFWTFGVIIWSDNRGHKVRINVALNSV